MLACAREGVADFADSRRGPDDQQRAIAGERTVIFEFRRELKPAARNARSMPSLLRDESHRFGPRDRFPGLVARDLAIVAIGHETREVGLAKSPEDQARRFETGEGPCVHE